jgi:hypothetical protein
MSTAAEVFRALQRQARQAGRLTQELLELYVLEGFLARLADSPHRDLFVLKGGVLLAAFGNRRPTRDVDLAALDVSNKLNTIQGLVCDILQIPLDDGLEFAVDSVSGETIREEDEYSGVRISARAKLYTAKLNFHVDVNVGDPIDPAPTDVSVPRLVAGEPIRLRGYPIHMVLAEKTVTAIQRGTANTRWRDYGDIWTLTRHHQIDGSQLHKAVITVGAHRKATLASLTETLDGYAEIAQSKWAAWRHRLNNKSLPEQFSEVVAAVISFGEPALSGTCVDLTWDPTNRKWG